MCGERSLEPGSSHPTASPTPQGPPPSDKARGILPLPAWQAAWPGPLSKEAHFLPPRARLMSRELHTADAQTPASICIHRP